MTKIMVFQVSYINIYFHLCNNSIVTILPGSINCISIGIIVGTSSCGFAGLIVKSADVAVHSMVCCFVLVEGLDVLVAGFLTVVDVSGFVAINGSD
jgi:hypothetical protein